MPGRGIGLGLGLGLGLECLVEGGVPADAVECLVEGGAPADAVELYTPFTIDTRLVGSFGFDAMDAVITAPKIQMFEPDRNGNLGGSTEAMRVVLRGTNRRFVLKKGRGATYRHAAAVRESFAVRRRVHDDEGASCSRRCGPARSAVPRAPEQRR